MADDAPSIEYVLSMDEPQAHYFSVAMTISNIRRDFVDVAMPTWTPGSYRIREFSRNIEGFGAEASNGHTANTIEKTQGQEKKNILFEKWIGAGN